MTMPSREDLLAEIAREESRLVDLRAELETATARLAGLREQLAALPAVQVPIQPKLIADDTFQGTLTPLQEQAVKALLAHDTGLLVATGRYIGEGFDDARLNALFLALPITWIMRCQC